MNKDEIIAKINDFLIEELELSREDIRPEATFKEDLGVDSLDFVDIAVIIEKNFNLRIQAEEMKGVRTLQDFYDYVFLKINEKP